MCARCKRGAEVSKLAVMRNSHSLRYAIPTLNPITVQMIPSIHALLFCAPYTCTVPGISVRPCLQKLITTTCECSARLCIQLCRLFALPLCSAITEKVHMYITSLNLFYSTLVAS
uniref:Uncharacterized protein n=1 Tax=Trypanosoma vivax (strain Y486) TaxID=1055687 RepID=G0U412_TRYVY|nr:hypothetical protein TVY486_1012170 [Trypanosoma vivax Y486]